MRLLLYPRVVLYPGVVLGAGCILHAGVVIGADGFGYTDNNTGGINKVRQLGSVRIGNYVEIGANSTIDCGTLENTIVGDHVKIDNLVQIGHNVIIGAGSIICGQTGIAGSCRIGQYCVLGGKVGVSDYVEIGDRVRVAGGDNVTPTIKPGETISSMLPPMPIRHWRRLLTTLRRQNPALVKK